VIAKGRRKIRRKEKQKNEIVKERRGGNEGGSKIK
jgi:hypothetical protein